MTVLKAVHRAFALEYLKNGENATAAYRRHYPRSSKKAAEVGGYRLLRKAQIADFVARERRARFKRLQMDGDEALGRVSMDARADVRKLFRNGKMIDPALWPDDVANSVEAVELTPGGAYRVKLASKSAARRVILEQTGKMKSPLEGGLSALARALRGDLGIEEDEADE